MRDAARMEVVQRERRGEDRGLRVRTRSGELADELRTAAMEGDRRLVRQLVAELLGLPRVPGHSRVGLQLPVLIGLIESLRALALSDELTGLYNRRGFMQIGVRFLEVARREGRAVQLLYFDLNNLKQVNDSMGHAAGDLLLRETGDLLRALFPVCTRCSAGSAATSSPPSRPARTRPDVPPWCSARVAPSGRTPMRRCHSASAPRNSIRSGRWISASCSKSPNARCMTTSAWRVPPRPSCSRSRPEFSRP